VLIAVEGGKLNRNYRKLLYFAIFLNLFWFLPFTAHACPISDSYNLPSHYSLSFQYYALTKGIYGSFTADVPIVAFIANAEGESYSIILNSALWYVVGTNGTYNVDFPDFWISHYVVFWNNFSSTAHIDYMIGVKITGFILAAIIILVLVGSIVIICIISSQIESRRRRKSEVQVEFYK